MSYIPGGYYLKPRAFYQTEIAHKPPHFREIRDLFYSKASFSEKVVICGKAVLRGQLLITYREIQEDLHWRVGHRKEMYTKNQVERAIKFLKKRKIITITNTIYGMLITICKYCKYQNPDNYEKDSDNDLSNTM